MDYPFNRPDASVEALRKLIVYKLIHLIGRSPEEASPRDWLNATLYAVRDLVTEGWIDTAKVARKDQSRRVYYLSMEFLMGRTLSNALIARGIYQNVQQALAEMGQDLENLIEREVDPGLGNGGLGRLAACFMDSLASLNLAGRGYGIRYEYGMFAQKIVNGQQVETPDAWLEKSVPWEFIRPSKRRKVKFGGSIYFEGTKCIWQHAEEITALAYDQMVPGYDTQSSATLRLWSANAGDEFRLNEFNRGDYFRAMEVANKSENVSRVLYPDDSTEVGRELRLRQEYFLTSASVQDILYSHLQQYKTLDNIADKIAIHLNDTHPVLAIPELMRILIDEHDFSWDKAWEVTQKIFSYTNHTLMSEALETWPVDLIGRILPRHLQIIFEINAHFLKFVREKISQDDGFIARVSLIEEGYVRKVRMAWLAVVASHKINGVAAIHSNLMTQSIFADFAKIFPERFCNITNGVTPRRWLAVANPDLSALLDEKIGTTWRKDLAQLTKFNDFADNPSVQKALQTVKQKNKQRLADYILKTQNIKINPEALFDVQIKRIHEYKRQFMNVLHIVARYQAILNEPQKNWQPRVFILAGKSASAYVAAKQTIHLINDVAKIINADERVRDLIKVVFIPNYNVSLAQLIIPAADVSEQISLAGTEASGTSNMKFALNGALTVGTLDGANVEILDCVGQDNIFIFGNTVEQVNALRQKGYSAFDYYQKDPILHAVIDAIRGGYFSPEEPTRYHSLINFSDYYQSFADFDDYVKIQNQVDEKYQNQALWFRSALVNIANMGFFSSDRTILEYADKIWKIKPLF